VWFHELITNTCGRPRALRIIWRHWARDHLIPQVRFFYRSCIVNESISNRCWDNGRQTYWRHNLDLSGSCDVIGHVTIRFAISVISYRWSFGTERVSGAVFEIFRPAYIEVTTYLQGHATSWLFDPQVDTSCKCTIVTKSLSSVVVEILAQAYCRGHDFYLTRSCDVVDHVTVSFAIGIFLLILVMIWNQAFISIGFRDIFLGFSQTPSAHRHMLNCHCACTICNPV